MRRTSFAILLGLMGWASIACGGYVENWEGGSHGWLYYLDADHQGEPMVYRSSGGYGNNGGYVRCNLEPLSDWSVGSGNYYPAFVWEGHDINLYLDSVIQVALRNDGGLNLGGGQIRFWIGEWIDATHYSFYSYNTPLNYGLTWTENALHITDDPSAWTKIMGRNEKSPGALFADPQQWGFMVTGASNPTGLLAFDSFSNTNVPEPASVGILVLAGLALARRHRVKSRRP